MRNIQRNRFITLFFFAVNCLLFTEVIGEEKTLGVKDVWQGENDRLCWTAATASVLHFYQKQQWTIPKILDYATCGELEWGYLCAKGCAICVTNCRNSIKGLLQDLGQIGSYCSGGQVSLSLMKTEIGAGRPIIAYLTLQTMPDVAHFVVICSYSDAAVQFMDPQYGKKTWQSYSYFTNTNPDVNEWTYENTLVIQNNPGTSFTTDAVNWDAIKWWYEMEDKTSPGGGYLKDAIATPSFCQPYSLIPGNNCGAVCGSETNVHNVTSSLWFSNSPGATFRYPISFPKKGVYQLKLSLRGSVCSPGGDINNGCLSSGNNLTLKEVYKIASVTISGSPNNYIKGPTIIDGPNLDQIAYSSIDNSGNGTESKCRMYTMALKDPKHPVYPLIEPGDKVVSFQVYITAPGVENVIVSLQQPVYSLAQHNVPGIVGLSIHKIETVYSRDFIYGCTAANANNRNANAEVDDGSCTYPPAPPPPPPYAKTFTFTGLRSHWKGTCTCLGIDYGCNMSNFRIIWQDGSKTTGYGWEAYQGITFSHTYLKKGIFYPYVEIDRGVGCGLGFFTTDVTQLGKVVVGASMVSILNLLLQD